MTSRYRDFRSLSSSSLNSPEATYNRRRERSSSPCSRFEACGSPTRGDASKRNFSSSSFTGYSRHAYPKVSVNKRLLTPLHLDIDPAFQEIRNKEKEEMKTLNNQFAALIGKVQSLEQHNQVLLTRWNILREQDNSLSDLDIKLFYDQYMNRLSFEIRSIDNEKEQLEAELDEVLEAMDDVRSKYEEEINKRTGMEFTFTVLKKDLDNGFLHKTELEAKLNGLHAWVELMKTIQEQELEELLSQTKDVSIVLGIDNSRYNPDLHKIVEDVRAQYEDLAIRSWEELEALTRSKLNEREVLSVKYGDHLLHDRRVIAELNIQIQKMRSCIVSLKSQCLRLEDNIKEVGEKGEAALHDAKAKLAKLEEALHNAKKDLAQLVKEYQELMNIKLALDIEILTYRKLMEGEEISMESPPPAVISRIYSSTPKFASSNSSIPTTSNMTTRAQENSTDEMSHSGSRVQSGLSRNQSGGSMGETGGDLSRSHSTRSAATAGGSFSRSPSSISGGASEAFRSHSTTHSAPLDSSRSRNTSSKNGNFANSEETMDSSVSRSLDHGSGSQRIHGSRSEDNPKGSISRSHSGGIRGISDGSLSRSQSNRSDGLTDSVFVRTQSGVSDNVQEGNYSRSQSHRSVGCSSPSISRTQSRESNRAPVTSYPRGHHSGSGHNVQGSPGYGGNDGSYSRSQSSRSQVSTDGGFARIHSHESEGAPESSLYGSYSGSSASYVEGGLSRSQSGENQLHSSAEPVVSRGRSAEDGGVPVGGISRSQSDENQFHSSAEPVVSRSRSAEDGGVPVGGISRSQSEASRVVSEDDLSRSQTNESELQGNHSHEGYIEPVSRSRSAEDGGVPVGGISRSQSGISREVSGTSLSRSQSGESELHHSFGNEGYSEPVVSRTSTAEDDGASVSGISRSQSEASQDISGGSLSRSQSDENEFPGTDRNAEPLVPRTSSTEEANISVGSVSRSSSRASRNHSQASFSGSQTRGFADSVFTRAHTEGVSQSGLSRLSSGSGSSGPDSNQPRRQSSGSKGTLESTFTRSQSKKIRDLTESLFGRTHSSTSEGGLSRGQSDENEGFVEAAPSRSHSHGSGGFAEPSVSRTHSGDSTGHTESIVSRSHSGGTRGIPEGSFSRSQSSRSRGFVESNLSRGHSNNSVESDGDTRASLASHSEANKVALESGPSRSRDAATDSFSRHHSDGSGGPVETSTPICPRRRMEDRGEQSLSRSQSGESGSFKAADFYRSSSEISRGGSEASLSRCSSKENKHFPEGILLRNYSYRCAVISPPQVSRTESDSEDFLEDDLSRSGTSGIYRSQSGDRENVSEGGVSRSYSGRSEEAPVDCLSHTGGEEAFPEGGLKEQENTSHSHNGAKENVWQRGESGGFVGRNLSRGQSSELVASSPVCLVCEVPSDEHHHSPVGEVGHSAESSITE
ncbi:uncharacterized protein LOC110091588 isoform X1 [Pogona vitticeps]